MTLKLLSYLWTTTGKHFLLGPLGLHHPSSRPSLPLLPLLFHSSVTPPCPLCQRWLTDPSVLASHLLFLILVRRLWTAASVCCLTAIIQCLLCQSVDCESYLVLIIHCLSPKGCCCKNNVHAFLFSYYSFKIEQRIETACLRYSAVGAKKPELVCFFISA